MGKLKSNKDAKIKLINDFGEMCFLLGNITKKNMLTYHHILAKRNGGKATYDNGALLCLCEHQMFNVLENKNKRYAEEVNEGFQEYKRSREYQLLVQMRYFIELELYHGGYQIEESNNVLVLKRK